MSPTDRHDADDVDESDVGAVVDGLTDDPDRFTDEDRTPERGAISGHARNGRVAADGGSSSVSEFQQMADVSMTDAERRRQWIDEKLLAPARIVWSDWRARTGVLVVLFYLFVGTVGLLLVTEPSPNQGGYLIGAFRTLEYPLGTTQSGVSLLSQVVHATPSMLTMVASGAVFTVCLGTVFGTIAGYKGGTADRVLMVVTDVMMTIPGLPLTIVLASALQIEGNPVVIGILVTINAWAGLARAIRSQVLTLRDAEYVEASRIMGMETSVIISGDIVPNLMPYITMNFVQQARAVIFGVVGLYFLGVLPYNSSNWGVMMNAAVNRAGAISSPAAFHWLLVPMVAVIGLALGLTLLAQGADRIFNPRVRARHAETVASDDDEGGI
ncbi:ABC transporter permease [Halomicrobium sp. LC1Hm]|uniref:ABC transporter permease n=1 Tax=Halomicrobium sp. LC1Hm TaxID=2610902 RepID=UPI001885F66D|nr:ABC transporter permease [Halomicrobium sp. LC1Hm]